MPEKKNSVSFYILAVILIIALNFSGRAVSSKFRTAFSNGYHHLSLKHMPSLPAMQNIQTPDLSTKAYLLLWIILIVFILGIIFGIRFLIKCCKNRSLGIERKSRLAELGLNTFLKAGCIILLFYSFTSFFQSLVLSGSSSMPLSEFLLVNAFFEISAILILYEFGFKKTLSPKKALIKNTLLKIKKSFLPSLKIYLSILPLFSLAVFLTLFLSKAWKISVEPQMAVRLMLGEKNPQVINLLAVEIVILAPLAEEMFFRGFLYRFLRGRLSFLFSAVISSAVFSLLHYNISSFLGIFVLGMSFAYTYEKKQSLVYPLTLHSLHNLLTLAFIFWIKAQLS